MPIYTQLISRFTHSRKSLLARGGLARTFGSLASFLALLFLVGGLYLLGDAFEHPLDAQAAAVLAAAFSIGGWCDPAGSRRPGRARSL